MSNLPITTRRDFLKQGTIAVASLGVPAPANQADSLDPSTLKPFVDPLPIPLLAKPSGTRANPEKTSEQLPYYRIPMREVHTRVHRDLPPTRMWSFGETFPGPTIET